MFLQANCFYTYLACLLLAKLLCIHHFIRLVKLVLFIDFKGSIFGLFLLVLKFNRAKPKSELTNFNYSCHYLTFISTSNFLKSIPYFVTVKFKFILKILCSRPIIFILNSNFPLIFLHSRSKIFLYFLSNLLILATANPKVCFLHLFIRTTIPIYHKSIKIVCTYFQAPGSLNCFVNSFRVGQLSCLAFLSKLLLN